MNKVQRLYDALDSLGYVLVAAQPADEAATVISGVDGETRAAFSDELREQTQ